MNDLIYDCIVLGGGISGLAASCELEKMGAKYLLLEAKNRLGGRIASTRTQTGNCVELGAEFMHGVVPDLTELFDAAGIEFSENAAEHLLFAEGKLISANAYLANSESVFQAMLEASGTSDMSLKEFADKLLEQSPSWQRPLADALDYISDLNACDIDKVSIAWLVRGYLASKPIEGDRFFQIAGGYERLVTHLAKAISEQSILLSHRVERIEWEKGNVILQSANSQMFRGKTLLITLPLNVLKACCLPDCELENRLQFVPELSEKYESLNRIKQGNAIRVSMEFDCQFWREQFSFLHSPALTFTTWWRQDFDRPVMVAWTAAKKADSLSDLSESEIVDKVIDDLSQVLSTPKVAIEARLLKTYFHNWKSDPFSRGAYCYVLAGGMEKAASLSTPIEETLFFAGEATDLDGASVHGAIRSGRRAAHEILDALKDH